MTLTDQLAAALRDALAGNIKKYGKPSDADPGEFIGDIFFGDACNSTRGTHRWNGAAWETLPTDAEVALAAYDARPAASDDVERVARAIYEAGIPKGGRDYVAWDDLDSNGFYAQHDLAIKQARAAIAAMSPASPTGARFPPRQPLKSNARKGE